MRLLFLAYRIKKGNEAVELFHHQKLWQKQTKSTYQLDWSQVLRPIVPLGIQAYGWSALRGGLSKGSQPVFTSVSEKTTENSEPKNIKTTNIITNITITKNIITPYSLSEGLGLQARSRIEPGTSRLPVQMAV